MKEVAPMSLPPGCNWSGFYLGLNGGYTWSDDNRVDTDSRDVFGNPGLLGGPIGGVVAAELATFSLSNSHNGFIGGGQFGYNQQFARFVAGVEADMQAEPERPGATRAFSTLPVPGFPGIAYIQSATISNRSVDYIGTVRGRLGFTVTPCLLAYATGGLAYGEVLSRTSITQRVTGPSSVPNPYSGHGSFDNPSAGWTGGGGLEWMFMTRWSIKTEYLYYDLGSVRYNVKPLNNFNTSGTLFTTTAPTSTTKFDGNIVRAGLNFHF